MKLQRKSLALMIGIACSGLLYGVNANASIEGFSSESDALNSIGNVLKQGESLSSDTTNLSVNAATLQSITAKAKVGTEKAGAIVGFSDYQDAARKNNAVNSAWYMAFNSYLTDTDKNDGTNGLLKKISDNLKGTVALKHLSIGADGKVNKNSGKQVATAAEASETLLTLIELAQEAKQVDKDREDTKTTAFDAFLKEYKDNLHVLGISKEDDSNAEILDGDTTARKTFMYFVNMDTVDVNEQATPISVKKVRENLRFLKDANTLLGKDVATKVTLDVGGTDGKTIIIAPKNNAKLSTVATLNKDLKDENDVIIASKGTNVSIKGDEITHDGKTYNNDSKQSIVFSNGKFNTLGKVDISNSNIQGAGNRAVAKSEAVFNSTGVLVNPADSITVLGNNNTIESDGIAIGNGNEVVENSIVVGNDSKVMASNAIALGNKATVLESAKNSIALGSGSIASRPNEINVGMWELKKNEVSSKNELIETGTRNISGVANATKLHDAVNLSQLNAVKSASEKYAEDQASTVALASTKYTNKQIATAGKAANSYTDKQVSGLKQEMNGKIDALDKKVNKGFAANAALSGLFQPYGVGKINMTAGVGGYQSESAVAVGVGYRVNENVAIKGGIATAVGNGSSTMYNASVNFEW